MNREYIGTGYYIIGKLLLKEKNKIVGQNVVLSSKLQASRENRYGMKKTHNEILYNNNIEKNNQSINEIEEILKIIDDKIKLDLLNN